MDHNVSATASIYQPRRLRTIAYVMAGLVPFCMALVMLVKRQTQCSMYTNRRRTDRQIHRIARSERRNYNNISVDRLRRSRVRTVGRRAAGRW